MINTTSLLWTEYVCTGNNNRSHMAETFARSFYKKKSIKEGWSIRKLVRQINSLLFERIALSKDKEGVLELSKKWQIIEKAQI